MHRAMPQRCPVSPLGLMVRRRTHRTQHIDLHTHTTVCYSEKIQSKTSRGKMQAAESGGNQAQASRVLSQVESRRTGLICPATNCDNTVKCCLRGKLLRGSVPRVLRVGIFCLIHPQTAASQTESR